jgi:hypothetical protein
MLICGQFIAKDLNLWSTLLFVRFEKSQKKVFQTTILNFGIFFLEIWRFEKRIALSKKATFI